MLFSELAQVIQITIRNPKTSPNDPAFTSQRDYRGIPDGKRQGCRYYASDGIVYDADWNASVNIANLCSHVSQIPVSHVKVLDGQAAVNPPIVDFGHQGNLQAPF